MSNRKIKFRIWNDKTKEWIHGPHENPSLDGVNLFGETIMFGELLHGVSIKDVNECIALQFTGLKDMNGKEIFEGDIIKFTQHLFNTNPDDYPTRIKQVKFDNLIGAWNVYESNAGESNIEVIGNVRDNPELI